MKMAKRNANNDLNRDNWDDDVEPEEMGSFKKATADELKTRVIKKAIRRKPADGPAPSSVFTGFSGFKTSTTTQPTSAFGKASDDKQSQFSFLSKLGAAGGGSATTDQSGSDGKSVAASVPMFSFGNTTNKMTKPNTSEPLLISDDSKSNSNASTSNNTKSPEYLAKLKELNQSLLKWITQHVNENPICILSPIFKDYEEHLKKIQDTNTTKDNGTAKPVANLGLGGALNSPFGKNASVSTPISTLSFAKPTTNTATTELPNIFKTSSVGSSPSEALKNPFSTATSPPSKGMFTFDATKSFTFANVAAPSSTTTTTNDANGAEEESEEPPKNEFVPVVESDSSYSKRCKVFVKKDNAFTDRGVGTLYLKPVKDTNKTQLLVRADTNLGNILVNVLLSAAIPAQKKKNNVLLVCLPTPESKPPPTPILLRVQNEEQADELLAEIKKCIPSEE